MGLECIQTLYVLAGTEACKHCNNYEKSDFQGVLKKTVKNHLKEVEELRKEMLDAL